jgi:hypothetical protein
MEVMEHSLIILFPVPGNSRWYLNATGAIIQAQGPNRLTVFGHLPSIDRLISFLVSTICGDVSFQSIGTSERSFVKNNPTSIMISMSEANILCTFSFRVGQTSIPVNKINTIN